MARRRASRNEDVLPRDAVESADRRSPTLKRNREDMRRKWARCSSSITAFCSPALQQPLKLGADVVMHSATKFLDGQGRVLGGALVGSKQFIMEKVFPFVRSAGPTLVRVQRVGIAQGHGNAVAAGGETVVECAGDSRAGWKRIRLSSACFIRGSSRIRSTPIAKKQQKAGGAIVSFELKGDDAGRAAGERVARDRRRTKICSITGNLGDTRTTITHPSTTTHGRLDARKFVRLQGFGRG